MEITLVITLALVIIIIAFCFMAVSVYNGLIALDKQVQRAWANIDIIQKQRFDEIPQLIDVIEQFTKYEQATVNKLVEARQNYNSAKSIGEKINASKAVTASLGNLIAIGEGYPELKSSAQFAHLQSRVSELENSIADRRELLNEAATNFNTRIEQFPDMIFAQVLNYRTLPLYKIAAQEKEQPNLKMKLSV